MNLFNKSFFRFAFGFIGIIVFSIAMIVLANALAPDGMTAQCAENCAH